MSENAGYVRFALAWNARGNALEISAIVCVRVNMVIQMVNGKVRMLEKVTIQP